MLSLPNAQTVISYNDCYLCCGSAVEPQTEAGTWYGYMFIILLYMLLNSILLKSQWKQFVQVSQRRLPAKFPKALDKIPMKLSGSPYCKLQL